VSGDAGFEGNGVRADSGRGVAASRFECELGASIKYYPRWAKGLYCGPIHNLFG